MMDSIRKQLHYSPKLLSIIWDHIAIGKVFRDRNFIMICKTCKLKVSGIKTNPQQKFLDLVFVKSILFG